MSNNLMISICLALAFIIAISNFAKSVLIERDVIRGVNIKEATAYRKKWFHTKKEREAYSASWQK